jgi:hypothetical protein
VSYISRYASTPYEGWANQATWDMHLKLECRKRSYRHWLAEAQKCITEAGDGEWPIDALAERLSSISTSKEVDWYELAGYFLDEQLCGTITDLIDDTLKEGRSVHDGAPQGVSAGDHN